MRCAFALNKAEIKTAFSDNEYVFVLAGQTNSSKAVIFNNIVNIPNLGLSPSGDKNLDNHYLIVKRGDDITSRKIERNDRTVIWAWDNLTIDAPIVCFGGIKEDKILIGELTVQSHLSVESKKLYSKITRRINKISVKCHGVNIGKQYYEKKQILTYSIRINPDYDFRYE